MWIEILLLLLTILVAEHYIAVYLLEKQLRNIPIVSKIPLIGSIVALSSFKPENTHLKFQHFVQHYGKTLYGRVGHLLFVVTADTRYVEQILSSQTHLRKHLVYDFLRSWLGNGLLLSHGSRWHIMRKIITPTFHFKILEQFVEIFDKQSMIFVNKLQNFADGQTVVNIYPHMGLLMLDVIAQTAMGVQIDAQHNAESEFVQAVDSVTNILATRFVRPIFASNIVFRLLAPAHAKQQERGIAYMHQFTNTIIEKRRTTLQKQQLQANAKTDDNELGIKKRMALLDVLLQARIDDKPLSDEQIRDEVNTFMFEGHDTTTSATSMCLYLLSRYPACQQTLFEEIHNYFGNDRKRSVSYADMQKLDYLNCVVKESLRLLPPLPAIGRHIKEKLVMEDCTLPAGSHVIILLWQILRDPKVFKEPEIFKPERFLELNERVESFSNIPFSAGPRNCIGQRFALFEMKTVIINVLRNYELLAMGADIQSSIKIVLRSSTGVNFGLKPRVYN